MGKFALATLVWVTLVLGTTLSDKIDFNKVCGVNLSLETTFKKRTGEIPYEPSNRENYTSSQLYPWVVSYGREATNGKWIHVCGGSIISEKFVLTSHHCYQDIGEGGMIRAGDSDLKKYEDGDKFAQNVKVVRVFKHPYRTPESTSAFFDVAVLELEKPLVFSTSVRRICLPKVSVAHADDRTGQGVNVAGYGEVTYGELQSTVVTIRPEKFCKKAYESQAVNDHRNKLKGEQSQTGVQSIATTEEPVTDTTSTRYNYSSKTNKPKTIKTSKPISRRPSTTSKPEKANPSSSPTSSTSNNEETDDDTRSVNINKRTQRSATSTKPSREKLEERYSNAIKIVPEHFNTSIMCIGSELGGIGACKGDDGGPGFSFETGNEINQERYVQLAVFHGSVECGLAAYPDIYVRLEEKVTLDFVRSFITNEV